MSKLFVLVLMGMLLLMPLSSGAEWDNVKKFVDEGKYGKIILKNAFGFGSDIAMYELLENSYTLFEGTQHIRVIRYSEGKLLNDVKAIDLQKNKRINIKSLSAFIDVEKEKEIEVQDYKEVCYDKVNTNTSKKYKECSLVESGKSKKKEKYTERVAYNNEVVPAGVYNLYLVGSRLKPVGKPVDIIMNAEGSDLSEWAIWWNNSMPYKAILNFTTGDQISTSYTHRVRVAYNNSFGANCEALTIVYKDSSELDSDIRVCNSTTVEIAFRNNETVVSNKFDNNYSIYYGANITRKQDRNVVYIWNDDMTASNSSKYTTFTSPGTFSDGYVTVTANLRSNVKGNILFATGTSRNFTLESQMDMAGNTAGQWFVGVVNGQIWAGATPYISIGGNTVRKLDWHSGGYNTAGNTLKGGTNTGFFNYSLTLVNQSSLRITNENLSLDSAWASGTYSTAITTGIGVGWTNADDSGSKRIDFIRVMEDVNARPTYTLSAQMTNDFTVTLNSPNGVLTSNNNITFNATLNPNIDAPLVNATLYVWNASNYLLHRTTNIVTGVSQNDTIFNLLITGGDQTYKWNVFGCASGSPPCKFADANFTFSLDTTPPTFTIAHPSSIVPYHRRSANINLNWTATDSTGTGTCHYQWNNINTTVACQSNTTNVNMTTVNARQFIVAGNDTLGNYGSKAQNWNYTIFEQNNSWNRNSTTFASEPFTMNVTWDNNAYSSIVGYLNYNGTQYLATSSGTDPNLLFTRTLQMQSVSGSTITNYFNWTFQLTNATGTNTITTETNAQSVANITLDDCTAFSNLITNFTIYDEDTRVKLTSPSDNTTAQLFMKISDLGQTGSINISYNKTNVNGFKVCSQNAITGTYRLDSTVLYSATNRWPEYYNIQNYTLNSSSTKQEISLYDLNSSASLSSPFKIDVLGTTLLPLSGVLVKIEREYLPLGTYLTVEIPKTDTSGKTIGHFLIEDARYRISILQEGVLLFVYNDFVPACTNLATGDCTLTINTKGTVTVPSSNLNNGGITASSSWNNNTKIYQFTYSSLSGLGYNVSLNISKFDNYGNYSVCYANASVASAVITCNLASYALGTYRAEIRNDTARLYIEYIPIVNTGSSDKIKYFFAFILIITLPFIAVTSGPIAMLMFMLGFIVSGALYLLNTGTFIGVTSPFLWLFIASGILLWKAFSGRNN